MTEPIFLNAGVLRRFAAMTYDSLLLMAISMGYYGLAVLINVLLQGQPPEGQKIEWGHWNILVFSGWLFVLGYFFCFFWRKSGQTLGMRAWRMKVVTQELTLISTTQSIVRCLLAPISLLLFGFGYFWRWFDAEQLTLHDRLSKTRVIVLPKK
jgi:uncharacterized RDD family membrane protein YckC